MQARPTVRVKIYKEPFYRFLHLDGNNTPWCWQILDYRYGYPIQLFGGPCKSQQEGLQLACKYYRQFISGK